MSEGGAASLPRFAVFGAGAVGCHFGAVLARGGAPVVLIGRAAHVAAIRERGLRFDSGGTTTFVPAGADTDPDAIGDADVVLLCVKSSDTAEAARTIAPRLRAGAVAVSMQNGVDNVERARAAAPGFDPVAAVVYVAASMGGPGHVVHAGRGDLVIGEYRVGGGAGGGIVDRGIADGGIDVVDRCAWLARVLERAGVPCRVSADVRAELWTKLVMNASLNAISALTRARYGAIVASPGVAATMRELVAECVAVARADGVSIGDTDALHAAALRLGGAMAEATSSTEQDLALGRATEIDVLNGYVVARGDALGVPAPVNRAMHALVKLLERAPPRRAG
jgi:2-dehydropantoate 2-reductase